MRIGIDLLAIADPAERLAAAVEAKRHPTSWSVAELAVVLLVGVFVSQQGGTDLAYAAPFVFGLALYVFAHEGGILSRALKTRPFAFLGLISYSLYMTHAFVIDRIHNVVTVLGKLMGEDLFVQSATRNDLIGPQGWQGTLTLFVIVLVTIVFSVVTYRFVEKPGMALGRRLVGRPGRTGTSGKPAKSPAAA